MMNEAEKIKREEMIEDYEALYEDYETLLVVVREVQKTHNWGRGYGECSMCNALKALPPHLRGVPND